MRRFGEVGTIKEESLTRTGAIVHTAGLMTLGVSHPASPSCPPHLHAALTLNIHGEPDGLIAKAGMVVVGMNTESIHWRWE